MLCATYRVQTKRKVERFRRYLRESFFKLLQTEQAKLVDLPLANRKVRPWLDEVPRIHATLRNGGKSLCDRAAGCAAAAMAAPWATIYSYGADAAPCSGAD